LKIVPPMNKDENGNPIPWTHIARLKYLVEAAERYCELANKAQAADDPEVGRALAEEALAPFYRNQQMYDEMHKNISRRRRWKQN
jgi:hypothetical protein